MLLRKDFGRRDLPDRGKSGIGVRWVWQMPNLVHHYIGAHRAKTDGSSYLWISCKHQCRVILTPICSSSPLSPSREWLWLLWLCLVSLVKTHFDVVGLLQAGHFWPAICMCCTLSGRHPARSKNIHGWSIFQAAASLNQLLREKLDSMFSLWTFRSSSSWIGCIWHVRTGCFFLHSMENLGNRWIYVDVDRPRYT